MFTSIRPSVRLINHSAARLLRVVHQQITRYFELRRNILTTIFKPSITTFLYVRQEFVETFLKPSVIDIRMTATSVRITRRFVKIIKVSRSRFPLNSMPYTFEEHFDSIEILLGVSGQNITFHNTLHHIPGAPYL
jgi:hypothetical protein